jgi:hypothetical protein
MRVRGSGIYLFTRFWGLQLRSLWMMAGSSHLAPHNQPAATAERMARCAGAHAGAVRCLWPVAGCWGCLALPAGCACVLAGQLSRAAQTFPFSPNLQPQQVCHRHELPNMESTS